MTAIKAPRLDIRNLANKAAQFQRHLNAVQAGIPDPGFAWYPYDSLGSFYTLTNLLTGERQFLLDRIGAKPVLDIGCGDGHIAFFLESLGCQVIAVDNPRTNFNQMQGVRALKAALNSTVEIVEQDIDYIFRLPEVQCSVAFLFGVLYHLKNPFGVLEALATRARYCLLSTRVARFAPDKATDLGGFPVAYLVDETETNNDSTNYWIFTNPGLKRLIERSGWRVADYLTVGNTAGSDPISPEGDERAFCFAERTGHSITNGLLVSGWHEQEGYENWRWTERKFSVAFADVAEEAGHVLRLDFFLPAAIVDSLGAVELRVAVNGYPLPTKSFAEPGNYRYEKPVPELALVTRPVVVEVMLDKAIQPEHDGRELSLVVSSVRLT